MKPINDPFKLCAGFMGKKDSRYVLNYIYSDGKKLYASNGHITIILEHETRAGFYDKNGMLLDVAGKWPVQSFDKILDMTNFITPVNLDAGTPDMVGSTSALTWDENSYDAAYIAKIRRLGIKSAFIQDCKGAIMHAHGGNFHIILMGLRR